MANTVDKVLKIAKAEVGYCEKSASAYKKNPNIIYEKTAGAGFDNYTKYGKEMHDLYPSVMDFPAAYCDSFVDWCFYKAYGTCNAKGLIGGDFNDYTPSSANLYKKKGAWGMEPKIGAQIFFKNSTRINHTGLVYDFDDKYVYTYEGNTSGAADIVPNGGMVCEKKYLRTNPKIAMYGYPKYDEAPKPAVSPLKITANVKSIQQWLNDRYDAGLAVDGSYGPKTKKALIKAWQTEVGGLSVDGSFGPKSQAAASKHNLRKGDKGILVTIWQAGLVCNRYNPNGIDGSFGNGCHKATVTFQKNKGLSADGVVGKKTWYALFK